MDLELKVLGNGSYTSEQITEAGIEKADQILGDEPAIRDTARSLIQDAKEKSIQKKASLLTPAQSEFVLLDREYSERIKPFFERYKAAKQAVIDESGTGTFFQDEDGVVYHTAEKKGQWVDFTPFEIQRTRREGETKGSLSMTAAREAGFVVEGK